MINDDNSTFLWIIIVVGFSMILLLSVKKAQLKMK